MLVLIALVIEIEAVKANEIESHHRNTELIRTKLGGDQFIRYCVKQLANRDKLRNRKRGGEPVGDPCCESPRGKTPTLQELASERQVCKVSMRTAITALGAVNVARVVAVSEISICGAVCNWTGDNDASFNCY